MRLGLQPKSNFQFCLILSFIEKNTTNLALWYGYQESNPGPTFTSSVEKFHLPPMHFLAHSSGKKDSSRKGLQWIDVKANCWEDESSVVWLLPALRPTCPGLSDVPAKNNTIHPIPPIHPAPPYPPILCAATSSGLFSWRYIRAELQTSTHRAPISRAEQHNTSNQPSIQPWYHLASAIWVVAKTAPLSFFPFHPACSIQHCIIWIFGILIGWQK